ncbi:BREX-1 system phosphatase PglZ type A [Mycolicibacterium sp. S3B2]|uniref:BREX-1 system phosphatase PglZ type A n=1 Tax=Mycolicibacterium sp. S3B2 TaxID=3415120 RepID=UPI003C7CA252
MSSVSAARISELLAERFTETPVLTWRDRDGEHADDLDAVSAALAERGLQVNVHRVAGDELGVKHRIYNALDDRTNDSQRQLLYRTGEPAEPRDDWLLDIEIGYGTFTADTTAILAHDLGLADRGVDGVLAAHLSVFASAKRTNAVRDQLEAVPADLPADKLSDTLCAVLSAAVLGLRGPGAHRLHRIVETLLSGLADDSNEDYDALTRHGLTGFLWDGVARIYGYTSSEPTVEGFAAWLFDQAWRGWPEANNAARIDFERLRGDRGLQTVFTALAERAENDLNIGERLREQRPPVVEMADHDIFPVIDRAVLTELATAVLDRTLPPDQAAEIVRKRSTTTWFGDYAHSYRAIAAAADCLGRIATFNPAITDPADGVARYVESFSEIDRAYRTFRHHLDLVETELPTALSEQVEHRYVEDYQRSLAESWQQRVDTLDRWHIPGVQPSSTFAAEDLPAKAKTLVIISDALRFDVGTELAERMNADDWFTAVVEPRLAPLPSFTQLGMARHLPHRRLELVDAETVLADGHPTAGLKNRAALWATADVAALDYDDVTAMRSDELAALWSQHSALVIYHDVIDATGDKASSERRIPQACDRAIDEIANLARKFGRGKTRASRILVTADHGFLFQSSELEPSDYLSEAAHGEQILARKRRYVVGRGLRDDPAFTLWTAEQLGLNGDIQVQIPRSLHRLRIQGTGVRYVHGGATLQEVVVPLVTLTQSRNKDVSKVTVDLNTSGPTVTSSTVLVMLTQREAVTGKRRGRTLRVGVYANDGTLLSNERTVVIDSRSEDIRDRHMNVELVLGDDADTYNGQTVQVRADELVHDTITEYRATSVTLQRGFGGFYDPL